MKHKIGNFLLRNRVDLSETGTRSVGLEECFVRGFFDIVLGSAPPDDNLRKTPGICGRRLHALYAAIEETRIEPLPYKSLVFMPPPRARRVQWVR